MRNFRGLKTLRLWLDYDLFRLFDWTFLGQESARDLRLIRVSDTTSTWHEQADPLVEELVRYCLTIPRTLGGEPLELEFPGQSIRASFARRIIELLKDSRRELTFRMYMDDALMLAGADYAVHVVDRKTTRYVSESSGIVVEVYRRHRPEHRQADNRVNKRANGTVLRILTDLTSRLVLSSNCTKYWSSLN